VVSPNTLADGVPKWQKPSTAMLQAMSEFFTGVAHQLPKVREFREEVLGGRLLTLDEAHAIIASYAARTLDLGWFNKWDIPVVGYHAEILDSAPGAKGSTQLMTG
jgi:hypothetical protein